MKLRAPFDKEFPLLKNFISLVSKGVDPGKITWSTRKKVASIEEFDQKIGVLDFSMLNWDTRSFATNQDAYLKIVSRLYNTRQYLLKVFGVTEVSNVITGPLDKAALLTPEAFEYVGENKTDIKENTNEYDLIYGSH